MNRFVDPGSILYPPYLLGALVLTLILSRSAAGALFSSAAWFHRATAIDAAFAFAYLLALRPLITGIERAAFEFGFLAAAFPEGAPGHPVLESLAATAVTMLAIDFASYAVHRLMHAWGPLWRVHRLHHSATHLTPFTTYRQHPLEPLILYGARGLAAGLALTVLYSVFPAQTPVITVSGLGAGFFLYMFTVNLHHAPIPVHYPRWLLLALVSPHWHHLHHSADPRHHGSNYGVVFSFWDRMFSTALDEDIAPGRIEFGLGRTGAHQPPPPPEERTNGAGAL